MVTELNNELNIRFANAKKLALRAGEKARKYFSTKSDLHISIKGSHDFVTNADLEVETFIRNWISSYFPHDGIIGEEQKKVFGTSGYDWIVDPIDGTSNFISGIPAWCIVLACVHEGTTMFGIIFEPMNNELYWASHNKGAFLNGLKITVPQHSGLNMGRVGVGVNERGADGSIAHFINLLEKNGGEFYRNGSGALMLTYVATGRLLGYVEPFMNAWDCLAAELLIVEAGGKIEIKSTDDVIRNGKRIIVGSPLLFDEIKNLAEVAFAK